MCAQCAIPRERYPETTVDHTQVDIVIDFYSQAFQRLNHLGLCLSHTCTLQLVKKFSDGHDAEVLKWKLRLEHMAVCDEAPEDPLPDEPDTEAGESSESIAEEEILEPLTGILCGLHAYFSYQILYAIKLSLNRI